MAKCKLSKIVEREWHGRPESVLKFFKCKYGKKEMKRIVKRVLK